MTAGPTSQGGRGSVAACRRPSPRARLSAQRSRPTRASVGRPGLRDRGASATGGGTWGRRPPRPGLAPAAAAAPGLGSASPAPSLAARRRPRLTCGLSSSVSSMGSLSIPGIVAEGGPQQKTRRPPTAPAPTRLQQLTPTRPLSMGLPPSPGAKGLRCRAGNPAPLA